MSTLSGGCDGDTRQSACRRIRGVCPADRYGERCCRSWQIQVRAARRVHRPSGTSLP